MLWVRVCAFDRALRKFRQFVRDPRQQRAIRELFNPLNGCTKSGTLRHDDWT
jgi:hypothetical protein